MTVIGLRPDDVVTDTAGNVKSGVTIKVYDTQANATAGGSTGLLASPVTDLKGRWSADVAGGSWWVRLPSGDLYEVADWSTKLDTATANSTYETLAGGAAKYAKLRHSAPFEGLLAGLSEGTDSIGISLVGDSTGDATDEWFYMLGQYLATRFPAYRVEHRVWADAAQDFNRPTVIQAGGATKRAVVFGTGTGNGVAFDGTKNISGLDLDVRWYGRPTSWAVGTQTLASKFGPTGAGDRQWRFQLNSTGRPQFDWTEDGSTIKPVAHPGANVPFAANTEGWVRVTFQGNSGGNALIKFYTSTDGATWTQLGVTTTTTASSINTTGTYNYELGMRSGGSEPMAGRVYECEIRDGLAGPLLAPARADNWWRTQATGVPTIEGSPVLTMVNGSHPGAPLSYLNEATRVKKLTPGFSQAVVFFSDSHNEAYMTGTQWAAGLASWVSNVRARLPLAAPVLLTQNPRYAPAAQIEPHAMRRRQTLSWARANGFDAIDTYQAFLDDGRGSALINADGIHPTQVANGGQTVWLNAIKALLV